MSDQVTELATEEVDAIAGADQSHYDSGRALADALQRAWDAIFG